MGRFSTCSGINTKKVIIGAIAGEFTDASGNNHEFTLKGSEYAQSDLPGSITPVAGASIPGAKAQFSGSTLS